MNSMKNLHSHSLKQERSDKFDQDLTNTTPN